MAITVVRAYNGVWELCPQWVPGQRGQGISPKAESLFSLGRL